MNINKVFHHNKELTLQCAQTGEQNVWVRVCWLAGDCDVKFSVENQLLSREKCFAGILKKIICRSTLKFSNENVMQPLDCFFNDKTITH
jgi:hypothetical protein